MEKKQIQSIGNYQDIEVIQEIPEYILLKAIEPDSKNIALIKIYFPKLKWSDDLLNEFFDRISYLKFIEHENLLPIGDFGKYQNTPYIVYPYHPFIFSVQNQSDDLDDADFLNKFYKIAEAMDNLHRQEIVHGLLGPETILIDNAGNPKIFDYGISGILEKVLFENSNDNFTFLSLSNIKYTAPEILLGGSPTRQSDIYSYSLLFYFGIFGEIPFSGRADPETAILHLENDPLWVNRVSPSLSKNTLMLIKKSLASKPENRFESFQEIIKILEQIKNSHKKNRLITGKIRKKYYTELPDQKMQDNALFSEDDLDRTFDNYEAKQEPANTKPRRSWSYIAIFAAILVGFAALLYYLFALNKTIPATGSLLAAASVSTPTQSATPNIPTVTAIDQAANASTETPTLSVSGVLQPPLPFKPALEGQKANAFSEKISSDNLNNLREFSRLGYGSPEDVDISSDSTHFAVATSSGVIIFTNNDFLKWIDPGGWASSVQFSPDGNLLAIGLISGEIQIWDWQKEEMLYSFTGHSKKITRILFSKNGRHLFSASNDQNIIVWDIKSQKVIQKILAHSVPIEDIAVSDDERILVSGAGDQWVRVWDLSATSKALWEIPFQGRVLAVAISSDGEYIAAGGDAGMIRQWNVPFKQQRTDAIPVKARIWNIKYINHDQTLFVGLDNGETRNYSSTQLKYEGESLAFKIPPVDVALIKNFGSDFQAKSHSATYGSGVDSVSIEWDGQVINRGSKLTPAFFDNLDHIVFSQDGKIVAAQGKRGITSVWAVDSNQMLFRDTAGLPGGQPISPDGSTIAVIVPTTINSPSKGNDAVNINIYRWVKLLSSGKDEYLSEVVANSTVSYSEDGKLFVAGSPNLSKVWDFESGLETFAVSNKSNGCLKTTSANDAKIFQVYSTAGTFFDWSEQTINICKASFYQQTHLLAMSHDLNFLAYIKGNGWLEAYDPISDKVLWTNNNHHAITAIALSPDGSMVAIGSPDGILTFLDGKTGRDLFKITGNYGSLQAIAFTGQGNIVATAGFDGTVRLFGVLPTK